MTQGFNLFTKQCHYTTVFRNLYHAWSLGLCCPILQNVWGKAVFVPIPHGLSPAEIWQSPRRLMQDLLSHTEYMEPRTNPYPTWFHGDSQRVVSSPPPTPTGYVRIWYTLGTGGHLSREPRHFGLRLREMRERRTEWKSTRGQGPSQDWLPQG